MIDYPQPAKDYCFIKYSDSFNGMDKVRLFDSFGCAVNTKTFSVIKYSPEILKITTNELNKGIYFIQIETGQSYLTEKLIIN